MLWQKEEGRKKKERRKKKWIGTQNPTNCKHRVDGAFFNPKYKLGKYNSGIYSRFRFAYRCN
ncbi:MULTISPECIES: hypothetical protein [Okeania]|uniref:hypothetical protein n=1 Tax=Okeania TaxID=1458928 RepID=UPI000F52678B|nr:MULTISPECIES: hypothetical protein [Okeania]NEP07106.1 hypothetical protein [Okeania sp. SIO4D6]NEQ91842.1 hypothetical protein [Okeania sp. SIO2G4]NET22945.1 hypothetical protein [Okeania sp. SIO1H5]NET80013.1 hypothetical protein [Okeania sp. SIO1F9]NET96364.1 hypothetical protein [Okeania sp. SIO1H2]